MFTDRTIQRIFIVSVLIVVGLPLLSIRYLYPSLADLIVENTEDEAARAGNHLARMLLRVDRKISRETLRADFNQLAGEVKKDFKLEKIKVFAPSGEIIYSTDARDIGQINKKSYFHEIVARGKAFSKVVQKDSKSMEGQPVKDDVMETYVPIIDNGQFLGAFELYYDISARYKKLHNILFLSSVIPFILVFVFLVAVTSILVNTGKRKTVGKGGKWSWRSRSPMRSMVLMAVIIFITEMYSMWFIRSLPGARTMQQAVIDSALLVAFITPILYFFFVQPLVRNVSDLERTEEALNISRKHLADEHSILKETFRKIEVAKKEWELTMDCVGDFIILADSLGTIKRVNKPMKEFCNKPYTEMIGKNWEQLILEQGFEAMCRKADIIELFHGPSRKWFEFNAYPIEYGQLHLSGSVITIHETTELKGIAEDLEHANTQINGQRNKLKSALDEVAGIIQIVTSNTDTSIRIDNPVLKTCYEVKNCSKYECPCYGKGAMRCWQVAGTYCGGDVQGQFAQKYGNCAECNVFQDSTSDPVYEIREQFNNMMHVIECKNRELQKAYDELKNAQAQMLQREKMASIGQLAAGVAHEINNPMGFISSNLGTLRKYADKLIEFMDAQNQAVERPAAAGNVEHLKDMKQKLKIDYIREDIESLISESLDGADRVKKIVQNLKSFSRVDEAEYKVADINECIESTLNIVWNELKYKSEIVKEYGEIPVTKCYPQQLNQVFMNLLVNAVQAIEKQGEIRIRTWSEGGWINISIADTGSGISGDKLNRIFDPFFTTKPVGQGTGLGLSIVYDIVKKHCGDITVESEPGKGTTFVLKIPVVEEKELCMKG